MHRTHRGGEASGARRGVWRFFYDRLGLRLLEYHVPEHAQTLPYMLGGIALGMFGILFATGIYLAQFYNPDQLASNQSVLYLVSRAPFGDFARSLHFWAANFVFAIVVLHMIRSFVTGSYKKPREFTWLAGLGLLAVTIAFIFTGTMLSLGQEGIEALEHNGEAGLLLGQLGTWFTAGFSASLPLIGRVYVAHIAILAALFVFFGAAHFYLIKAHGISRKADYGALTGEAYDRGKSRFEAHLKKLVGWFFLSLAFLSLLALLFPEPLGSPGAAGIEATKPPWMLLWVYGMENVFGITSLVWGPALLFLLLAAPPFIDRSPYLSPRRRPWIMAFGAAILIGLAALSVDAWLSPIEAPMTGFLERAAKPLADIRALAVPVAYAHNMPFLSFAPAVVKPGETVTVSGDGLKTAGGYFVYLKGPLEAVLLGTSTVAAGDDHFDADMAVPADLPGAMYSVEMKSANDPSFDFYAPLQLAVEPTAVAAAPKEPAYAEYPIPPGEVPWIAGLIAASFGLGALILANP